MPIGTSTATILGVTPLNPSNIATLDFSRPMFNGIRIIPPETLLSFNSKYYGDEINLNFWKLLRIPFGTTPTPSSPLTLQSGYRYVYNHDKREFDVYDSGGVNIIHTTNITSIADLNIDFTIHKSHQFEIIVDPSSIGLRFIFPAKLVKDEKLSVIQETISEGVDNIYAVDRIRPYNELDIDNPSFDIKHIDRLKETEFMKFSDGTPTIKIYEYDIRLLDYFWEIDFKKNYPTNYFYLGDRFNPVAMQKLLQLLKSKELIEDFRFMPMFNSSLYPALMPVQRAGETVNNRPVYEPWLIWVLDFLYNYRTDDFDDELDLPIFDLSPRFS